MNEADYLEQVIDNLRKKQAPEWLIDMVDHCAEGIIRDGIKQKWDPADVADALMM